MTTVPVFRICVVKRTGHATGCFLLGIRTRSLLSVDSRNILSMFWRIWLTQLRTMMGSFTLKALSQIWNASWDSQVMIYTQNGVGTLELRRSYLRRYGRDTH